MKYLRYLKIRVWYAVFKWVITHGPMNQNASVVANRHIYGAVLGPLDIEVTIRNTREQDGYSREEVYKMLARVRREEIRMDWRAPEPTHTVFDI